MGTACRRHHRRLRRTARLAAVLAALMLASADAIVGLNTTGSLPSDPTPTPTTPTPTTPTPTTPTPPTPTTPTPTSTTPKPTTPAPPATTTPPPTTTKTEPDAGDPTPAPTTSAPTTAAPTTAAPTTSAPTTKAPVATRHNATGSHNGSGSLDGLTAGSGTNTNADKSSASSGSNTKYGIVIAVGVFVVVVLVALVCVLRRHRSKKGETDKELRRQLDQVDAELGESAYAMASGDHAAPASGSYSRSSYQVPKARSPSSWSSSRTTAPGSAGGDRDSLSAIWKDPEILAARIPYEKLKFRDLISRGGFGEVFHGVYHNQRVAIKRILPENRKRMASLEDFMKEALLLSTLEHERIVQLIGVAWDSPRDLCIVLEYMPNGDLRSMLSEWRELGRKTGWADVRKVRIALHISEALTYLHTLTPKVVHRDLKSKNVLLDASWQAKISDFGVSREESTHNTMTSNVGSSLWIAPEVMMGNNYDEKADIFSFGIVLTELDSLQLPYHNAVSPDGRKIPDAAVLHLVTMGKMQAEFSSMSRTDMVLLGRSCLALDPTQRPSAAEVRYRLSQILGSY